MLEIYIKVKFGQFVRLVHKWLLQVIGKVTLKLLDWHWKD